MKLVLMRHAEAFDALQNPDRPLTSEGRDDAARMGRMLAETGWAWKELRSSPVIRARETAEIVAPILNVGVQIEQTLEPGCSYRSIASLLRPEENSSARLFVLHMPDIAVIAGELLGLPADRMFFSPGSAIGINLAGPNRPEGMLIFQYQPGLLA
ncbi:MAG: histidine phosphatase family protein [Candidatus Riflebacteria bacterium]